MKVQSNIRRFLLPGALATALIAPCLSFSDALIAQETPAAQEANGAPPSPPSAATSGAPATPAPAADKKGEEAEKAEKTGEAGKAEKARQHARRAPRIARASAANAEEQVGQAVFQVLLAEIALQRGNPSLASSAYADLALRTHDPEALERTIEVALYGRQFDVALDAARLWTELDPKATRAYELQASVLALSRQTDDLAPTLARLLALNEARRADILLGLPALLGQLGDRQAALDIVETVSRPYANMAEAHYAVAVVAAAAERDERARAEARRALELRPGWTRAALLQTQILFRAEPQEAIDFLSDFARKNPHSREAKIQLARLFVSARRYDAARAQFKAALKDYPNDAEILFSAALVALQQKDPAEAEAYLKHLLTIPETDKNAAFFFLGQIAEEDKRIDEALDHYAKVLSGEHLISAQIRRAYLLAGQNRMEEARAQLRPEPGATEQARVQLTIAEAGLLREAKQYRAAFAVLEAALAEQPEQPDLLYESALLLEKLDNLDLMERRLRRLIVLRPDNPLAYNALGYSLADRNLRLEEARALIEKAHKLSPEDFYILDSMGWVLYRQGDLPGALDYLEKARAKNDDPEIVAHLGEVLWVMGRRDEARTLWQEMQKRHPDSEALNSVIKKFLP